MEIKIPQIERREIEIRETYLDENGRTRESVKKVSVPTGKLKESNAKQREEK